MLLRVICLLLVLLGGTGSPRAASACCCSSAACCKGGEHPKCPMLPNGTCAIGAVDQRVATATPTLDQPPPLSAQHLELVDLAVAPAREFLSAPSPHPPPLFLLHQSFRN